MRFLVRLAPSVQNRDSLLPSVRTLARSVGVEVRNPKQTSYGALEVDVFCPSTGDLDVFLATVTPLAKTEFVTDLNKAPEHLTDEEILAKARKLFNDERYWECHEVLEGLWRQKHGEERSLLQGIILVCAALVHHQKREEVVALSVLGRAARQLDSPRRNLGALDLSVFTSSARRMLEEGRISEFVV